MFIRAVKNKELHQIGYMYKLNETELKFEKYFNILSKKNAVDLCKLKRAIISYLLKLVVEISVIYTARENISCTK